MLKEVEKRCEEPTSKELEIHFKETWSGNPLANGNTIESDCERQMNAFAIGVDICGMTMEEALNRGKVNIYD